MKYSAFIFTLLFITNISVAQSPQKTARANIQLLKNGALLVRLKTSELQISGLKSIGKEKEAADLKEKQDNENRSIVKAFKTNFTFCPVYFFYSNSSNELKAENYKGLMIDLDTKIDPGYSINNYLVGEFDESETTQIAAFVIKDKNYVQLRKPFPYLIKQNEGLLYNRSNEDIVSLLNKKLFEFYGK